MASHGVLCSPDPDVLTASWKNHSLSRGWSACPTRLTPVPGTRTAVLADHHFVAALVVAPNHRGANNAALDMTVKLRVFHNHGHPARAASHCGRGKQAESKKGHKGQ